MDKTIKEGRLLLRNRMTRLRYRLLLTSLLFVSAWVILHALLA